jgi:hypothetical protein
MRKARAPSNTTTTRANSTTPPIILIVRSARCTRRSSRKRRISSHSRHLWRPGSLLSLVCSLGMVPCILSFRKCSGHRMNHSNPRGHGHISKCAVALHDARLWFGQNSTETCSNNCLRGQVLVRVRCLMLRRRRQLIVTGRTSGPASIADCCRVISASESLRKMIAQLQREMLLFDLAESARYVDCSCG